MSNGEPIIIKGGGSIEVTLYKDSFPPVSGEAHKHYSADRDIIRMTITDDSTGKEEVCKLPASGKFTIRIDHSKKPKKP
jgi:hypothetical protein